MCRCCCTFGCHRLLSYAYRLRLNPNNIVISLLSNNALQQGLFSHNRSFSFQFANKLTLGSSHQRLQFSLKGILLVCHRHKASLGLLIHHHPPLLSTEHSHRFKQPDGFNLLRLNACDVIIPGFSNCSLQKRLLCHRSGFFFHLSN